MNQPKFKFLDKVRNKNNGESFEVAKIVLETDTYVYFNRSSLMCAKESELGLFTEPKSKKLFAFEDMRDGEIKFYSQEIDEDDFECDNYKRVPCFDINYSDKE